MTLPDVSDGFKLGSLYDWLYKLTDWCYTLSTNAGLPTASFKIYGGTITTHPTLEQLKRIAINGNEMCYNLMALQNWIIANTHDIPEPLPIYGGFNAITNIAAINGLDYSGWAKTDAGITVWTYDDLMTQVGLGEFPDSPQAWNTNTWRRLVGCFEIIYKRVKFRGPALSAATGRYAEHQAPPDPPWVFYIVIENPPPQLPTSIFDHYATQAELQAMYETWFSRSDGSWISTRVGCDFGDNKTPSYNPGLSYCGIADYQLLESNQNGTPIAFYGSPITQLELTVNAGQTTTPTFTIGGVQFDINGSQNGTHHAIKEIAWSSGRKIAAYLDGISFPYTVAGSADLGIPAGGYWLRGFRVIGTPANTQSVEYCTEDRASATRVVWDCRE